MISCGKPINIGPTNKANSGKKLKIAMGIISLILNL